MPPYTASSEQIPVYSISSNKPGSGVASAVQDKAATTLPDKWYPPRVQPPRQACYDRFIPQRRHQNFEASNYILTRVPPRVDEDDNKLDVFGQLSDLETTWRKKLMRSAMEKTNILPDPSQHRVLNIGKPAGANRGSCRTVEASVDDNSDGVWKVRPRDKPLIDLTDFVADVPTLRHNWGRGLLDWGATHFIAAMIGTRIVIFDGKSKITLARTRRVLEDITNTTRAIKWNNAGTKIAICTNASQIMVHDLVSRKHTWCRLCRCTTEKPVIQCEVVCVAWTHTDAQLVIGCTEGRISSYKASVGTMIDTIYAHTDMILAVRFSPSDRYLVSTGMDKAVRVHTWPDLTPYLAIGYYEPVLAFAWHPWEVDKLCVGGGFADGSLTFWDIHRQTSLGFRKVPFFGSVKNMTWNKLSAELVVQWNYHDNDNMRTVVPVLASLDRIVDCVGVAPRIMDIVWNPDGTQLAIRSKNTVKVENFFGNETSRWFNEKEEEKLSKKTVSAGRTANFQNYNIR